MKIIDSIIKKVDNFNNVIQFFLYIYSAILTITTIYKSKPGDNLIQFLSNLNPLIKLAILIAIIFFARYYFKRAYKEALYIIKKNQYDKNILSELQYSGNNISYEKLIPPEIMVETIYHEFEQVAIKWSKDAYFYHFDIKIHLKNNIVENSEEAVFFSKRRNASLTLNSTNFKIENPYNICPDDIQHKDFLVNFEKPFFQFNKKWRNAFIECLERVDSEIAGKNLYLVVGTDFREVAQFYIDPFLVPKKTYFFYMKDDKIYKDILDITTQNVFFTV